MGDRVIVLGGGPAGCLTAGLLARAGVPTTLVTPVRRSSERAEAGAAHGAVTMDEAAIAALERALGVEAALRQAGTEFSGREFVWGERREPWSLPGDGLRVRLGGILRDGAAAAGATVVRGQADVLVEDRRVLGVRVGDEDLQGLVIDASGTQCVLGRALGGTKAVADRRLRAVVQGFDGGGGAATRRRVVSLSEGWLVSVPDGDGLAVGFVHDAAEGEHDLERLAAQAGWRLRAPRGASRTVEHPAFVHGELAGDGWLLVGEAGCFVDPVFGSSVGFAVAMAERAVSAALLGREGGPPVMAAASARYSEETRQDYRSWLRVARYWYRNNRGIDGGFWRRQAAGGLRSNAAIRAYVFLAGGTYSEDPLGQVVPPEQERAMFRALGADERAVRGDEARAESSTRWTRDDAEGGTRVNLPSERGQAARRVELFIASGCNLHCAFCCESDRIQRKAFMPWEELDGKLVAAARAGIDVIQFMGGEATLHPRFPDALKRAKQLGLGTYVITNLMRWQRRDFAEAVGPWLDEVMVSMHAGDAETGLEVTGVRNWWKGFQVAAANARDTLQGRVRASTVLTRHNVDHLEAIADTLLTFRPHAWVMGCAVPVEGTRVPAEVLNLTLTELRAMRPRFAALSARCAEAGCKLVFFSMPHCVLGPELWDDSHDLWLGDQDLTDAAPSAADTVTFWSQADDLPRTRPVTLARTRAEPCRGCARREQCGGHFKAYLDLHGDSELEPVRAV